MLSKQNELEKLNETRRNEENGNSVLQVELVQRQQIY